MQDRNTNPQPSSELKRSGLISLQVLIVVLTVAATVVALMHPACIEHMLLEGAPRPNRGATRPDLGKPGHGLEFKARDAQRYAAGA